MPPEGARVRLPFFRDPVMAGWYVAAVCLCLMAFDAAYLAWGTYREPLGDARLYVRQSSRLIHDLGQALPVLPRILDRPSFTADPQGPPGAAEAVRWYSFQGFTTPAWFAAVQLLLGEGHGRIRAANVLLHVGDALLVWRLGVLLASPAVGLAALTLFACYLPFTYMASQLLTENLAAFLILLTVYLGVLGIPGLAPQGRRGWATAAAFGLGLLFLAYSRAALAPLAAVMLLTWAARVLWRAAGGRKRVAAGVAVGALCVAGPYLAWQLALMSAMHLDHFSFATTGPRSVGKSLDESYDTGNHGWPAPAALMTEPGRVLFPVSPARSLRDHPVESVLLRAEKLFRLWKSPATAYTNPLTGGGTRALNALHVALLLAGGLALAFFRGSPGWLLAAVPVAYTTVLYTGFFSEERRFVFPVMALVIVFAGAACVHAWERLRARPPGRRPRPLDAVWAAGLLLAAVWLGSDGFVVWGGEDARAVHTGAAVLLTVCLAVGLARAARFLAPDMGPRPFGARLGAALALAVVPVGVHFGHYADGYTWAATLDSPDQRIVQAFVPPPGLTWDQVASATLQIDARVPDGRLDNLDVRVNDAPRTRFIPGRDMPPNYRHVVEFLAPLRPGTDWDRVDVAPDTPVWLLYPLDPRALTGAAKVTVSVGVKRPPAPGAAVTVFGELPWGDPVWMRGPRPWLLPTQRPLPKTVPFSGRNSLWRYQTYGDMRIHGGTYLEGTRTSAFLPAAGEPRVGPGADLSPAPLRQTGSYRIRLQIVTRAGTELFL